MRHPRSLVPAAMVLASLAACDGRPATAPGPAAPTTAPAALVRLDSLFERAGREFNVPASLLKAIGYVETRWQMVTGAEEFPGVPPAFGIMALRGERLERGAALAGVSSEAARTDPLANIRAAAALLGAYADEMPGALRTQDRADLGAWAPVAARYSGIEHPQGQAAYVRNDVYAVLREGVNAASARGAVATLAPSDVQPRLAPPAPGLAATVAPDYDAAVWRPSPNFNDRPAGDGGQIRMVIVHSCEGAYTGCWSWLVNPSSQVSAHYVVKEDGSEVSQLVAEEKRGWHIAALYDCTRNEDYDCARNGQQSNHFTVGVEHGGFASQTSWPAEQIDASSALVCDITRDREIPRDRFHIVSHAQLQPYNRTDPGRNWPWADYYARIDGHCASALVIDSDDENNDPERGRFTASAQWNASTAVAGYYGSGYRHAAARPRGAGQAAFSFYLPEPATRTVDAWWPSAETHSHRAPFVVYDASGRKLETVYVNQRADGGQWNTLGTWTFSAGWNRIVVSRRTTGRQTVVADAVRIR